MLLPPPFYETGEVRVKAALRKAIGKQAGDTVHVQIDERIG